MSGGGLIDRLRVALLVRDGWAVCGVLYDYLHTITRLTHNPTPINDSLLRCVALSISDVCTLVACRGL